MILGGIKGLLLGGLGGMCTSIWICLMILAALWDTKLLARILGIK